MQGRRRQIRAARDVTIWRIRVKRRGRQLLSFRFKFLSEEFPEFVGSEYNDAFIAELDHSPSWDASGSQSPTISAPNDFATTRNGNDIISVNAAGVAKVSRAAAKGTTYDAATGKLRPRRPSSRVTTCSTSRCSTRATASGTRPSSSTACWSAMRTAASRAWSAASSHPAANAAADREPSPPDRPSAASIAAAQVSTGVSAELPHSDHEP